MGKFEDLKKLKKLVDLLDDDEADVEVEVVVGKDNLSKRLKELEEEGFSLMKEEDPDDLEEEEEEEEDSSDAEDDIDELRKKAREQHKEIVEKFGEEMANAIVDYAGCCAMIVNLVRCDIPIEHELVDNYNKLCKKVHPESCDPMLKAIAYMTMREMVKEGKKNLG